MGLSEQDLDTIKLTIINTLNERIGKIVEELEKVEAKADKANLRIVILVSFLAGSGVLGGLGYGIIKTFGGGS